MSSTNNRAFVSFASIDSYIDTNVVLPTEKVIGAKDMVEWGDGNSYPDYLLSLYNSVPTLRAIINGNIDYITGDDVSIQPLQGNGEGIVNQKGETIREQIKELAKDYEIYGGFALQVIRNLAGEVSEIYTLDMRHLRCNKECNVFYYSENWDKRGKKDTIVYPAFLPNLNWASLTDEQRNRHASSVLFVKNVSTQVYPAPLYAAAVKSCEIERMIDTFHINSISNQFASSALVNFNNGIPDDEVKKEIEREFNEKFSGAENAGRMIFSWNPDKESATDIIEFKVEDFGERYKALSTHSRQQIYTAFRAIPLLFGLTSEANTGFSTDEFEQSFKLYNRTQIKPVQRLIADAYDKIYGASGVMSITPFTMDGNETKVD